MSPHQILTVCIRLVAIIWLLFTLSHLDGLFAYSNEESQIQLNKLSVLAFASLQVGICVLFWLFPKSIAAKLLPVRSTDKPLSPTNIVEWQTLGVICVGIWALTRAIPDAVYWITFYNMMSEISNLGFAYFSPDQKAGMISTIAELSIGLWLVLGAKGIAALLFKVRTAGITHETSE